MQAWGSLLSTEIFHMKKGRRSENSVYGLATFPNALIVV